MVVTSDLFRRPILVALITFLIGCGRKDASFTEQDPGIVTFADAGVSVEVGNGWQRIDASPSPAVCSPTLVGKPGMLRAMLFPPDRSDIAKASSAIRFAFDGNAEAVKDSFRQEPFSTESGVRGVQLSYAQRTEKDGRVTEMHSHNYVLTNHAGRCVSISYISTAANDSDTVQQLIRKSLKLK